MKRFVGIDFGLKRIGLALSDPLGLFAQPLGEVLAGKTPEESALKVWSELKEMMKQRKIEYALFVIGLPITMKGDEKERATQVKAFGVALQQTSSLPIQFLDERLSSLQAERSMKSMLMNRKERAKHVDTVSASIILQCYLDQQGTSL